VTYELTFIEQFKTIPEFHFFIDSGLSKQDSEPVVIMPMFLSCPPEELSGIATRRRISAKVEFMTQDIFIFEIGLRKRSAKGFIVNYGSFWCGFLVSRNDNDDTNASEVASRWMSDMFPIVTPTYITSRQMLELIDGLKIIEKSKIIVLDYVTRSVKEGETTKRWKGGEFSKEEIATKAKNDSAIVDAIRIGFSTPNFKFIIKLNRRGLITVYNGSFSEVQRLIVSKLIERAKSNLLRMKEMKRILQANEVSVEPLVIKPDNTLDTNDLKQLKESLSKHYMIAVLYGGNPWLLLSLLDKSDGSAVDLQAYKDEIIITPVTRASSQSLTRLFSILEEALPSSTLQLP
jgi:hypothetical protein